MSKQWNLTKAILLGALIGALYSFAKEIAEREAFEIVGALARAFGGAVGGAFLFGAIAALRNLFVSRNSN
ncbi:MAG: hypothetical protein E5X35_07545 [Mesorhizobium sp.]|uniref:hypothetical protein n=1 Tax=Mesorhizobium sp. TaxID=1871066 RepID=UPI0007EE1710|nr:hypothetical protein [Mesorhizobium sp.]TIR34558.1 MAG: hypothetical protein E5X35_07545 [Mesorhizobium sp.]